MDVSALKTASLGAKIRNEELGAFLNKTFSSTISHKYKSLRQVAVSRMETANSKKSSLSCASKSIKETYSANLRPSTLARPRAVRAKPIMRQIPS